MKADVSYGGISPGENLINFINNASTCVKSVLSKPGCFKRNTNHRRFLQKQLRQNVQDNIKTLRENATAAKRTKAQPTQDQDTGVKLDENEPPSPAKQIESHTLQTKTHLKVKQKTIRKKRRYNPIRLSPPPMLQPPAPLLIPSPMSECSPEISLPDLQKYFQHALSKETNITENQVFFNTSRDIFNNYQPIPSPDNSVFENNTQHFNIGLPQTFLTIPTPHLARKSSSSSYASSVSTTEEDFGFSDFLSGEDLMRSLEFNDLFIPEKAGSVDFLMESPNPFEQAYERQMQYLAQLEAIEACYEARENDLLMNFIEMDYYKNLILLLTTGCLTWR